MRDRATPAAATPTIGRASELALVDRWLGTAEDGHPRVGIVRGAPGVGKSHLLRVAGSHAATRGFRVLAATGFTGSPPMVPALTALAPLLAEGEAGRRGDLTDDDAQSLRLLARSGPTALDGGTTGRRRTDDTHRYLAAVRLVLGAARTEPLLLLIDDAHALDEASAALVTHLLSAALLRAEAHQVRVAALLGVRPGEGSPAARRAVARMSSEPGTAELELGGLDELELNELLTSFGPHPPSRPLLRLVRSRTEGNPLHSRLLWDHLLASGGAVVEAERVVLGDPADLAAAHLAFDDVIDTRLDALDERDRSVLAVAAVLGPEGDLAGLTEVLGSDPDEVEGALLRGEAAGLCHLRADGYAFDQPLVAAVLGRSITARRRQRLHLRLAEALAARPEPRVHDVAAHLRDAGDRAPAAARRQWCAAAGERAVELGAWSDAVAAFTAALDDDAADDLETSRLLALYVAAATASGADHDLDTCERFASRGIQLARATGDVDAWCAIARALGHARVRVTGGARVTPVDDLDDLLAAVDDRPDLAAGVTALLAEAAFAAFDFDVGLAAAREATHLARLAGDDEVLAFVLFAQGLQHQGRFELDESERCFAESIAVGGPATRAQLWSRDRLPSVHWLRGDLAAVESAATAGEAASAEALDWAELSLVTAWRAAGAGASGRLGEAIGLAERALALQRRSDYAFTSIVARPVLVLARALRGDTDGARRAIEEWGTGSSSRWQHRLGVLALALSGDVHEAGTELDRMPWRLVADEAVDLRTAASLCAQVEVGDLLDRPEMAAAGHRALASLHRRGVRFVPGSLSLVSRLAGVAAARGGDPTGAAGWLATARRDAAPAGAAGGRARTDLDEVRLLGAGGAGSRAATEGLAGAATTFDHLGMLPFLRRCEATAAALGLPSAERLGKVVLFTDLVGSTALNAAAGDRRYVRLLRTHDRVVRDLLQRHDGVEFKHTGDGLAAWFSSARRAVRCALDLHGSVAVAVDADFGLDVRLRCGLAAGDPIEDAGDLFGLSVARAARLCQQAAPGEVLVSSEVLPMVGDATVAFADRGLVPLRGIPEPTHVFAAAEPGA